MSERDGQTWPVAQSWPVDQAVLAPPSINRLNARSAVNKMSVRASAASDFSLRSVDPAAVCAPLVLSAAPERLCFPLGQTKVETPARCLKFDFSSLQQDPAAGPAPARTPAIQAGAVHLKNAFAARDTSRADVMRLSAVVDELASRQKRTAERASVAEAQLQKVSGALLGERDASSTKIKKLSSELRARQESEAALRAEVEQVQQSALSMVPKERLDAAVGGALLAEKKMEAIKLELDAAREASEETSEANAALTEELVAMHADHQRVSKELEELDSRHSTAIFEARVAREEAEAVRARCAAAEAELAEARARMEEAEARVVVAARVAAAAEEKTATSPELQAALEAARGHSEQVEAELGGLKGELAAATADLEAARKVEVKNIDPVAMHGAYQTVRGRVLRLSAAIAGAGGEQDAEALVKERGELLQQAEKMKQQYDTLFGASDASAEPLAEDLAREILRKEVLEAAAPTAEPPSPEPPVVDPAQPEQVVRLLPREPIASRAPGATPSPRRYADTAALRAATAGIGMAVSEPALQDCCCNVGETYAPAITARGVPIEAGAVKPQGGNDVEYIHAVVAGLNRWMKAYTDDGFVAAALPAV